VYTVSEDQSLSHALITAFERETDLDLTRGEPINDTVDLEALDQFYPANTEADTPPRVQFTYRDHEVTIEGRDEIHISSVSSRGPQKRSVNL
jgi:hypothetical protein